MPINLPVARLFGALALAIIILPAAGCSLLNDFAPRSTAAVSSPGATAAQVMPAVLVQQGATPPATTVAAPRSTNIDSLPPLPKDSTTANSSSKLLSPEERDRVIAELEALARGDVPPATTVAVAKTDCSATTTADKPAGQASAATACQAAPKPALRP